MEFIKNNLLVVILSLVIVAILIYPFLFMSKEKAAAIVYDHVGGTKWDKGYLVARAKAIRGNTQTFRHNNAEYNTTSGKKVA